MEDFMRHKIIVLLVASLILIFSFSQGAEEKEKIDLKKVAENITKAYKSGDAVAIANLYAEDAIVMESGDPEPTRGRKAIQEKLAAFFLAYTDYEIEFLTVLISGNHIVFEQLIRATYTGPSVSPEGEIPSSGKRIEFKAVWIARISPDGLIEEDRTYLDNASIMRQLGQLK